MNREILWQDSWTEVDGAQVQAREVRMYGKSFRLGRISHPSGLTRVAIEEILPDHVSWNKVLHLWDNTSE